MGVMTPRCSVALSNNRATEQKRGGGAAQIDSE